MTLLPLPTQVFDKARRTSQPGMPASLLVGVALRGVHAMVVSTKGFERVGPTFRVDSVFDMQGRPEDPTGNVCTTALTRGR